MCASPHLPPYIVCIILHCSSSFLVLFLEVPSVPASPSPFPFPSGDTYRQGYGPSYYRSRRCIWTSSAHQRCCRRKPLCRKRLLTASLQLDAMSAGLCCSDMERTISSVTPCTRTCWTRIRSSTQWGGSPPCPCGRKEGPTAPQALPESRVPEADDESRIL
ncbi:hypothetical protein MUK42_30949 [Musa troglodytarum]|uniref:Secreted protein n=1 Tax=Musa troglodytarum TaxID=320322 RepID=A0A9E7FMM4_9LILI|nr:hypothetical protein MUK42_30949 [Musa troglodytarum]